MNLKGILLGFCMLLGLTSLGQENSAIKRLITGSWEGAIIIKNAYQKIEVDFSERNGDLFALQIMDEWHPTFGEFEVPVTIDSNQNIHFNSGYGPVTFDIDAKNLELIGEVDSEDSVYVHLKKVPRKPASPYQVDKVMIESGDIQLSGHLHLPINNPTKTVVILVGGRGCFADLTEHNLYAKFLREYGIAVLAYQKRGTGESSGDCSLATIEDLANDVRFVKSYLEAHDEQFETIGVLGISAGGWTMTKAEENVDFDFMISVVGPSTSVKDQQLQSAKYGAEIYDLTQEATNHLLEYTELLFLEKPKKKEFKRTQALLELAENEGWIELLEETDVANSLEEMKNLWVVRHNFDPELVLRNFSNPFLALYGERDWIVPVTENTDLLLEYFAETPELLTTVNVYNADHGMEMESRLVQLESGLSYRHFYRVSPEVRIEIVEFLALHGYIE
ncbi:MAG: alpha/beta hydrolase [Fluviicola sp.]